MTGVLRGLNPVCVAKSGFGNARACFPLRGNRTYARARDSVAIGAHIRAKRASAPLPGHRLRRLGFASGDTLHHVPKPAFAAQASVPALAPVQRELQLRARLVRRVPRPPAVPRGHVPELDVLHEASFTSPEACMPKRASPMNAAVGFEKWEEILPRNRRSCLCALNAIVVSYAALAFLFVS